MADVYVGCLASMAGFERLVAITIIHKELAEDPAFIEMFLEDARIAAGIHHPNVGEMLEVGMDGGLCFVIGELIQGQSLRSIYRRAEMTGVDIPHTVAAYIGSQICLGAHAAHELCGQDGKPLNLIHRDISPRNILVSYDGFANLIDFGMSWAQGRDGDSNKEAMKGKIGFMSPEQVRGEPPMDRRSDLFSLGIVLYLMIAGEHPFCGRTPVARLNKLIRGHMTPLHQLCPDVDPELEKIVLTALSPNMEDRFESAQQMGQELENYIRGAGAEVGSDMLSGLMHSLFVEEIEDHEQLLKECRKKSNKAIIAAPVEKEREAKEVKEAKEEELLVEEIESDIAEDVTVMPERMWNKRQRAWTVGAGALLAIAAFLLLLSLSDQVQKGHTVGIAVSRDEQPVFMEDQAESSLKPKKVESVRLTLKVFPETANVVHNGTILQQGTREILLPADGKSHVLKFFSKGYLATTEQLVADRDMNITVHLRPGAKVAKSTELIKPRRVSFKSGLKIESNPYI
ncbi:MAG: serine/threonine protein kinase [Proteobacteria bacterium]|nr:serine/threonine protein kinase [Pseudomonadota bacterium]